MMHVARTRGGALVALALTTTVGSAVAAWPDDPAVNVAVADAAGTQGQAKIRATADGGAYVSWFDDSTGGWDVFLQRLDAAGNEVWPHNGLLVADRGFSSTQDYGLDVDTAGNALLAFRDDRFTGTQITAAKVAPDGTMVWGANGIQLTSTTDFVAAPKITGTSDGNVVVAWRQGDDTRLRKLHASGFPLWLVDTVLVDPGGQGLSVSDLHASDLGSVIVGIVRGFAGAQLHAQKVSSVGGTMWGANPLVVFDGSLQFGNFPTFVTDGAGGAVFGWYGTGPLQCYAQHVLADGTELFPHNGVAGSTDASHVRVSPSVGYSPGTDEIFLFWTELNSLQSQWGVYGQKYDSKGLRQWGATGTVLVPLGGSEITWVRTLVTGSDAIVLWVDTPSPPTGKRVVASRVNGAGSSVWSPAISAVSSTLAGKSRLDARTSSKGIPLLAWTDERADSGDIFAQNVNVDGTLGLRPADVNGDGCVSFADILVIIGAWGPCPPGPCPADVNGDGDVGFGDILGVIAAWD